MHLSLECLHQSRTKLWVHSSLSRHFQLQKNGKICPLQNLLKEWRWSCCIQPSGALPACLGERDFVRKSHHVQVNRIGHLLKESATSNSPDDNLMDHSIRFYDSDFHASFKYVKAELKVFSLIYWHILLFLKQQFGVESKNLKLISRKLPVASFITIV